MGNSKEVLELTGMLETKVSQSQSHLKGNQSRVTGLCQVGKLARMYFGEGGVTCLICQAQQTEPSNC